MPPAPGIIPSLVSGRPTEAEEAKTRRSVESASSKPPPRATEATALMMGTGKLERVWNVERRLVRNSLVLS